MKRKFKGLLIILAIILYLNIGYFLGASQYKAEYKLVKGQKLTSVEKFFVFNLEIKLNPETEEEILSSQRRTDLIVLHSLFWPIFVVLCTILPIIIFLGKILVPLFKPLIHLIYLVGKFLIRLIFCGGLTRPISPNL